MTVSITRRGLRLLALVLVVMAAAELGARVADPKTTSLYDMVERSDHRFKMRPGAVAHVPERYGTVAYTFNRAGYRDREHPTKASRARIVLLGDSVTFGLGVAQDRIYAAALQRRLEDDYPGRFEVANLAIFAYHTANELDALKEDGLSLRPAVVVVQFFMNDFAIPSTASPQPPTLGQRLAATRNRFLYRSALVLKLQQGLQRAGYLALHDLRRKVFQSSLNKSEPIDKLAYLRANPDDRGVAAFRKLADIASVARAHGANTLILVTPDEVQLYDTQFDYIDGRIVSFARAHQIPVLDLLPAMRNAAGADLYLDGVHLTARGHALVAQQLAARLQGLGWLAENQNSLPAN